MRLANEMIRLYKVIQNIVGVHMQIDGLQPHNRILATPSPRQSFVGQKGERMPVQQKHGSISYTEYRENSSAINKLSDTIKLF